MAGTTRSVRNEAIEIEKRFLAAGDLAPVVQRCTDCGGKCGGKKKDHGPAKIVGYAATFGTRSQDLGGFVETIRPGAFKGVLKRAASGDPAHDVVALWNHDPNLLLGRLSSGTLKLYEDERGLRYEITPPAWASGYVESVSRGDVTGSSFSFSVSKRSEQWSPGDGGAVPLRSISDIDRLVDVGPVVFPAYLSTESKVSQRALAHAREIASSTRSHVPAIARATAALEAIRRRNCGTGKGGFQPGNQCAKGGGGDAKKKNFVDTHPYRPEEESNIKAGRRHSLELHVGPDGALTPERLALHRKIIETLVPPGAKPPSGRPPVIHILGGGPASGKSTMLKKGGLEIETGHVEINPDTIKEMLPEYEQLLNAGSKDAARFVHDESSNIAHAAKELALSRGLDIVLDGTGDGRAEELQSKIEQARGLGYKVVGHYASNSIDNAMKGAQKRYEEQGRWVPEHIIRNTHANVTKAFTHTVRKRMWDEVQLFDTNVYDKPRKVYSAKRGEAGVIHDQQLWDDFLRKGDPDA